jgi:hypothetical protein
MESITDWAFSWPISAMRGAVSQSVERGYFTESAKQTEMDDGKAIGAGDGHTLIVVDDIAKMVPAAVMGFPHAHRVVCKIDIAVVACQAS